MQGKRLVVDACVGGSAGNASEAPMSKHSREALSAIRENMTLYLAMNPTLLQEWKDHGSRLAISFLTYMVQRRRIVFSVQDVFSSLMNTCAHQFVNIEERAAFVKDAHLLASALDFDRIVVSNEVRLRKQVQEVSHIDERIASMQWANPSLEGEACADWIARGAPSETNRFVLS